jgi:hypothetical protein
MHNRLIRGRFVRVNFMFLLKWTRACQIAGKTLFIGVPLRVFPEEISIRLNW